MDTSTAELTRLRKENEILRMIIEEIPASIYWKNAEGTYLGRNIFALEKMIEQGFEKDRNRDFIIGKTDYDLLPSEIADQFSRNDEKIISTGEEELIEESFTNLTGKEYHHLSIKKPLYSMDKKPIGIVGISLDVTELKNTEKREQIALAQAEEERIKANAEMEFRRAISIFAGSIGHDLRTPLTSLLLTIDLFQLKAAKILSTDRSSTDKNSESPIEYCHNFSTKLKNIISEMNDFISITLKSMQHLVSGSLTESDFTLCRVEDCLNEVLMKYPFKEQEKSLVNIEHIDNFEFLFHPVLFYRILFNLITNSLQQIEKNGYGKIYISTENTNNTHILRFKDTAGGASEETIGKLFSGYHTTKKEGTGIGLAFCKLAMQSSGGDITCHSKEGDYIEFELSFSSGDGEQRNVKGT